MAVQKTVSVGLLSIFQLLMLLRMIKPVDSVAAADPCQSQLLCVPGTRMGDENNCRRYYECNYPEDPRATWGKFKRATNLNDGREKPRWMPKMCRVNTYFSILESECVRNSTSRCQKKCADDVYIGLRMVADQYHDRRHVLEGSRVQFFCSFRYLSQGYVVPAEQFVWLQHSNKITSRGKQTIIASYIHPDENGFYNSTLTFASVTVTEAGNIRCGVQYNGIFAVYADGQYLVVWKPWIVLISPVTLTVFNYEQIALKCTSETYDVRYFKWYIDEVEIESGGDVYIGHRHYNRESYLTTSAKFYNTSVKFSCWSFSPYGNTTRKTIEVFVINENDPYCPEIFDATQLRTWNVTKAGTTSIQPCKVYDMEDEPYEIWRQAPRATPSLFTGAMPIQVMCSRKCALSDGSANWLSSNCDECVEFRYADLFQEIVLLEAGIGLEDQLRVAKTARKLATITHDTDGLTPGNLNASLEIIRRLTFLRCDNPNTAVAEEEVDSIVESINNLLEPINTESWKTLQTKNTTNSAFVLLSSVDVYGQRLAKLINETETVSITSPNLVLEARRFDRMTSAEPDAITFPLNRNGLNEDWITSRSDMISVSRKSLSQICSSGNVINLWSSYFRNIENYLPVTNNTDVIGSRVLSLSVKSLCDIESVSQPINISLQHKQIDDSRMKKCVYWNFDSSSGNGYWDDSGCTLISTSDTHTFCQCNHLKHIAILFSLKPSADVVLSIISTIGCSISEAALILTVIVYALSWKEMKSDQTVFLLNICVALIAANTILLAGADKTSHQYGCKAVAVLLHYFFLAAFFLMLAEGVQLLLFVSVVFHVRSKIESGLLIASGWVLPLIVVAVSLVIPKTNGYKNSQSCWLSVDNGLIWAFVGPALSIILINFIIVICVMTRVFGDRVPSSKNETKNKIRASMKNLAVVCPLLGIAWVSGVLSVSFNHVAFQYVFAITNGSQGLFVFIFHVILRQKKGKQGSLIWNLLRCVRRKSISSTSASGLNTAAEKLATVAGKNRHGKERQEETQINDSGEVYLSSESSL